MNLTLISELAADGLLSPCRCCSADVNGALEEVDGARGGMRRARSCCHWPFVVCRVMQEATLNDLRRSCGLEDRIVAESRGLQVEPLHQCQATCIAVGEPRSEQLLTKMYRQVSVMTQACPSLLHLIHRG